MIKVALCTAKPNSGGIDPTTGAKMWTQEKRPPVGIGYLKAVLDREPDIKCEIHDYYSNAAQWPSNDYADYDVVGFYCTSVCKDSFMDMIKRCKAKRVIVGGPHATLYPGDFITKYEHHGKTRSNGITDHIVIGEAENVILKLVRDSVTDSPITMYSFDKGKTNRLSSYELDKLPRFPYEYFVKDAEMASHYDWDCPTDNKRKTFTMNTSRGCPFDCSFCQVRDIWSRNYTYMSPERVLNDIMYCRSLGAERIYFREDCHTCNRNRITELCNLILDKGIDMRFMCETRADLSCSILELMKASGYDTFYVGAEAASDRMLKVFNKHITADGLNKFFEGCKKVGIAICASWISGHPEETRADVIARNKFIARHKPVKNWINTFRKVR